MKSHFVLPIGQAYRAAHKIQRRLFGSHCENKMAENIGGKRKGGLDMPSTDFCDVSTLPVYDRNRFFREIAKMTEKYFENPENKKKFEEWKRKKAKC